MPETPVPSGGVPAVSAPVSASKSVPVPAPGSSLSAFTTLRLGGPAGRWVVAGTSDAVIDAVRECDTTGTPLLLLAGGSNLVVADDGFPGTVVRVVGQGIEATADGGSSVRLRVTAGQEWDSVVRYAVEQGWAGIEALSGIPGSAGATPMQNVGAYGQEVAETIVSVRTWDRQDDRVRTLEAAECEFTYRSSRLKLERFRGGPRFVVLDVTFRLSVQPPGPEPLPLPLPMSMPVRYAELARTLGVAVGEPAGLEQVRQAVLGLRRGKGMVLDAADNDTWSAGSFFTNPILGQAQAAQLPAAAPRWPAGAGAVKTSAAWLIEHAGFGKGYGLPGPVALSTKHTLALTNRGSATTADLLRLAREVRDGVRAAFGIQLEPEPVLVGCAL